MGNLMDDQNYVNQQNGGAVTGSREIIIRITRPVPSSIRHLLSRLGLREPTVFRLLVLFWVFWVYSDAAVTEW